MSVSNLLKFMREYYNIELHWYQIVELKMLSAIRSIRPNKKGCDIIGQGMRRHYGNGKISKRNHLDEPPQKG